MSKQLTIRQVMDQEHVSRQTVHRWISDGLPSSLVNVKGLQQERRIDARELASWLEDRRSESSQ